MIRTHHQLPDIATGYALDDVFSVIVPYARTNEVTNPSGETATTGYTAGSGTLTRSTEQQYHGAYSFKYVPAAAVSDGFYYGTISTTSGQTRAISCKFRGAAGVPYALTIATTGGVDLVTKPFTGTGRWQWVWLYHTETSSTTRRIYFRKNASASTTAFYVDGVQSEVCGSEGVFVTTYIDGDQTGLVPNQYPPAYLWTGTPHASSSTRSGLTRAGGRVMRFKDFQFLLTAIVGLGLALPQNVSTDYARIDGGYDDYTRKPTRQFTLTGQFNARTYQQLRDLRGGLAQLLDRDRVGLDQRLLLRHHLEDARGVVLSDAVIVPAKYAGGLDGNTDNQYAEAAPITFTQYMPYVQAEREEGAALTVQQSVTNANYVAIRSAGGTWSAIGTGGTTFVYATVFGTTDEYLYLSGAFASINGVANTRGIARYSLTTQTVSAMGTGASAAPQVYALAVGPNGHVWAVGAFTSMGGAANSSAAAEWDGSAWSGHTYPGTGAPRCVTIGPDGVVYMGSDTGQVHKWDGSSWTLLGTAAGSGADVFGITVGPDGNLYVVGDFTSVSAVSAASAARYTLSSSSPAWQSLNNAPSSRTFMAIDFAPNGIAYIGGFDTGGTTPYAYSYNGTQWYSLGTFTTGAFWAITATPVGVYFGAQVETVNGVAVTDGILYWNGATFVPGDVDLPGGSPAVVYGIGLRSDGTLAVGYNQTGTATAAGITTVTNTGTLRSYPTLTIKGPSSGTSRIHQIVNYTTGRGIYLNYTINAGETAILRFTPDNLSFTSDFRGNIASTILPGSNEADFFLQPGANSISFFAASSTVTATLEWSPCYASLDDVP